VLLDQLKNTIKQQSNEKKASELSRFFKTAEGQYGYGDIFIGIQVPQLRKIAKEFAQITIQEAEMLLNSKIHEERMIALFILIAKYENKKNNCKQEIFDIYIKNIDKINNWDLVDLSAPNIVGNFLLDKNKDILYKLAVSQNLWHKRIAIISTFYFIKNNIFEDTLKIADILLNDKHDLIHKAVGWMLREIGKRNIDIEKEFLQNRYKKMPRTMLRYAIEKFDENTRQKYLKAQI